MLRPVPLILTFLAFLHFAATAQDTVWFDAKGHVSSTHLYSYGTRVKNDSGWLFSFYYHNGKPKMIGQYDDSMRLRQGICRWFFQDGMVNHLQTFAADTANGLEQYYYDNGQVQMQGITIGGNREGEWSAFFPSGGLAAKAQYAGGIRVKTTLYNEDGTLNTRDTLFYQEPAYPGGASQFLKLLNKKLRYPDAAFDRGLEGTVMVRFHVSKEGKVSGLVVEQSADRWLDAEAIRVLGMMQDWEPAILAGVAVEGYRIQPVVFSLHRK
jgi:TonB family protein